MSEKRLWEHKHPYHCSPQNYFAGLGECLAEHDSWADFYAANKDADDDYNLLFRFDWYPMTHFADDDEPETSDILELFYIGQRKGLFRAVKVKVTADDEPAVREWLRARWAHLSKVWEPIAQPPPPPAEQEKR